MTPNRRDPIDLRQGTLDLLILRVLAWGPTHGHNIVKGIERASDEALLIDHGSLYPTLQRLEGRGLITADWGTSENNLSLIHISEPTRLLSISYAVFCLKKKK